MKEMENIIFRCDSDEKHRFQVEAEKIGLNASIVMRQMVHSFLNDRYVRQRLFSLQNENTEWEF